MGVDLHKLVIGHVGNLFDPQVQVHKDIAKRGAFVGFDRVGRDEKYDVNAVTMVVALVDAGYTDNVILSSDGGAFDDILKTKGGPGYARALTVFLPKLR